MKYPHNSFIYRLLAHSLLEAVHVHNPGGVLPGSCQGLHFVHQDTDQLSEADQLHPLAPHQAGPDQLHHAGVEHHVDGPLAGRPHVLLVVHKSMATVMLGVVKIKTFGAFLMLSSWVRIALTTLRASFGSDPEVEFFLAAVRVSTSSIRTQT